MTQLFERLKIKDLSIEERIALVEEIWESIAVGEEMPELTDEQKAELDRPLESYARIPMIALHGNLLSLGFFLTNELRRSAAAGSRTRFERWISLVRSSA